MRVFHSFEGSFSPLSRRSFRTILFSFFPRFCRCCVLETNLPRGVCVCMCEQCACGARCHVSVHIWKMPNEIRDILRPAWRHDVLCASSYCCPSSIIREELNGHGRVCICNANFSVFQFFALSVHPPPLPTSSICSLAPLFLSVSGQPCCGRTRVKQSIFHFAVRTSKMSRKNCVRIFNFVFCVVWRWFAAHGHACTEGGTHEVP